ncbi:MAG: ATP-binding cassette domain-containing protein, partial [Acidimicrobiia bacterium]|nr:ATP-binding cassette domain-containing protein [Acidimicrobiia bacterium]
RFAHGDHHVLVGVDLEVRAGETVALVGATGSGKTTLLELGAGLIVPDSGTIRLGPLLTDELTPRVRASRLALVFQEAFLFAESVRENITMGEPIDDARIEAAARLARAHEFISELPTGYQTVVGERGTTLSGGQRQRVALARALLREPSVLLLDDATSAVDPSVESQILAGLRERTEATVLIVAHRLSTIQLADRVAFLHDGRIVATGRHDELLRIEAYRTLAQAYEEAPAP